MKNKITYKLATLSLLALLGACSDRYNEGFSDGKNQGYTEGYDVGYDEGHVDGDADGYARGQAYFEFAGWDEGHADGKAEGISIGYNQGYNVGYSETHGAAYSQGYTVGRADGRVEGHNRGYNDGYDDGYGDGFEANPAYDLGYSAGYASGYEDGDYNGYSDGHADGSASGYDIGYTDGSADGYDVGYDHGWSDGYDIGYDDGWYDGGGLSVGKTAQLKGYANILSMAHNDMIDYAKIPAPKATSKGLFAKGRLLLAETSQTNKDTLKRAAVVEQYLVTEMARQINGKFGLSKERSLMVAKVSNHFRKQASRRSLTNADTNIYLSEIVGADLKTIEKAVESSLKGDLSAITGVLEKAAQKNGISPEKMGQLLAAHF